MSADMPPSLILDILSRLPVKSLCRFKCVSKSWFGLINHSRFSKIHLSRSSRRSLLLQKNKRLFSLELGTSSCLRNSLPVETELPRINIDYDYFVYGSCNGLVCIGCLFEDIGLLLYNPSTKDCKQISDLQGGLIGFGYVESADDYKIVEIPHCKNEVRVYSLKEASWISVESNLDLDFYANTMVAASVNGAIHFVLYYDDQYYPMPMVIAAFDLEKHEFKTLPPPDCILDIDTAPEFYTTISVLNGCLCLSIETDPVTTEIWVMKEYDVTESWTRILTVGSHITELHPLCYLNNDKTMLAKAQTNKLMLWDSEDEELKDVKIIHPTHGDLCTEVVYMESLVSPTRISEVIKEDEKLSEYWFN